MEHSRRSSAQNIRVVTAHRTQVRPTRKERNNPVATAHGTIASQQRTEPDSVPPAWAGTVASQQGTERDSGSIASQHCTEPISVPRRGPPWLAMAGLMAGQTWPAMAGNDPDSHGRTWLARTGFGQFFQPVSAKFISANFHPPLHQSHFADEYHYADIHVVFEGCTSCPLLSQITSCRITLHT